MTDEAVDRARLHALADIERSEALYRAAFVTACLVEALLLGGLLWTATISDRTHLLLLIGFVGSYTVCVLSIVALGAHMTRLTQRILRAIDTVRTSER